MPVPVVSRWVVADSPGRDRRSSLPCWRKSPYAGTMPGDEEEDLADQVPEADAITSLSTTSPPWRSRTFARSTRCKCVVRAAWEYNNIDLERRKARHRSSATTRLRHRRSGRPRHDVYLRTGAPCCRAPPRGDPRRTWHDQTAIGLPDCEASPGLVGLRRIGTRSSLSSSQALGLDVGFYDPYLRQGTG